MESKTTVRRPVLDYCVQPWTPRHERATIRALARWLAELLDWPYGGSLEPSCGVPANCYLLPTRTLVMDRDPWRRAGQPADLLGGQVDHLLTATKAIVHPRLDTAAPTPPGWSAEFARAVQPVVLPGYTAFAVPEALRAGQRLLRQGPGRIKPVLASGGRGREVVADRHERGAWLAGPEAAARGRGTASGRAGAGRGTGASGDRERRPAAAAGPAAELHRSPDHPPRLGGAAGLWRL